MKRLFWAVGILAVAVVGAIFWVPSILEGRYNRVFVRPPYAIPVDAANLQKTLFVADLHADTLLWGRNLLTRTTRGHVDLPRLDQANVSLQFFTVVTTIPRHLNIESNSGSSDLVRYLAIVEGWPLRTWNSPKERALYQAGRLRKFASDSHGALVILRTRSDLEHFIASREPYRLATILGSEGAQPLEGELENLDVLRAAGYRLMSPTHFTDTEIGGSASGERKGGLTDLGRLWVHAMEAKGMLIDLAHASPATVRDVTSLATKSVIVSHTGVKGTCNNNRNLSDDEIRAVARTGGVIGIGYWETAICGREADAIARAILYTARIVGVEHVALGSDFDGSTTTPFDATGIPLITDALLRQGLSEPEIRLVMGENVLRVLSQTLPD
jgi:membrane dipeptidase